MTCVYCYIQEGKRALLRKATVADRARLACGTGDGHKEPSYICNECGAIFERYYDRAGNVIGCEMENLRTWKKF